jgi:hypothetical protein
MSLRLWVRILPGSGKAVCCECCVLSGRGLCDELITRPEESYLPCFVVVCDLEISIMMRLWLALWAGLLSRYSDWLRAGGSGDRIPVGARFSAPVQTGPGAHLISCTMGTGSLPGVKRLGRDADPSPLLVQLVKKE